VPFAPRETGSGILKVLNFTFARPIYGKCPEALWKMIMSSCRYDEPANPSPYRSKRLYRANGQWYFDPREGTQFGPFRSQEEARMALAFFVAENVYTRVETGLNRNERPGVQDGIEHMVDEALEVLRCHKDFGALAADSWIKCRLESLDGSEGSLDRERIGILRYAMDHAEQLFDPGLFLEKAETV